MLKCNPTFWMSHVIPSMPLFIQKLLLLFINVSRKQNKPLRQCPFLWTVCGCDLVRSGFFHHSGEYICTEDYQRLYGTQCDSCDEYITGEVVSAMGRTYHPHCFVCSVCRYGQALLNKLR